MILLLGFAVLLVVLHVGVTTFFTARSFHRTNFWFAVEGYVLTAICFACAVLVGAGVWNLWRGG